MGTAWGQGGHLHNYKFLFPTHSQAVPLCPLAASRGRNDAPKSPWMQGPEGRPPNVSPEGMGINPEEDPSAVGAELNRFIRSACVIRNRSETNY
jgi:hypothetical protein